MTSKNNGKVPDLDPTLDGFKGVVTAEDPRIVTPVDGEGEEVRLKVSRELGTCARCGAEGAQTITAYDSEVYEGEVCGPCVLSGKAAPDLEIESPLMRPMVFVAKALRGDEPFRTLLRAADDQRENPGKAATVAAVARAKAKMERRLSSAGLLSRAPLNRHERRLAAKQGRRARTKAKKRKQARAKTGRAQIDAFDSFAEGFDDDTSK